jgi:hypothetical protein
MAEVAPCEKVYAAGTLLAQLGLEEEGVVGDWLIKYPAASPLAVNEEMGTVSEVELAAGANDAIDMDGDVPVVPVATLDDAETLPALSVAVTE